MAVDENAAQSTAFTVTEKESQNGTWFESKAENPRSPAIVPNPT